MKNVYFESEGTDPEFEKSFKSHTAERQLFSASLTVYGHKLHLPSIAVHPFKDYYGSDGAPDPNKDGDMNSISNSKNANIARFSFAQLCDDAVGAADYIAISELFDIVFLERIPQLKVENRNQVSLLFFCDSHRVTYYYFLQ